MTNRKSLLPGVDHYISLAQATAMTARFRKAKEEVRPELILKDSLPICETFDRAAFDQLLKQEGCVGIRLYLGMDDTMNVQLIAVGVNEKNEDILPSPAGAGIASDDGTIVEEGQRCPDICPPPSPLNSI